MTPLKRMEKLKEHQSKLTRMSQNLSSQLDKIHQISPSTLTEQPTQQPNQDKPNNLIRNLSITITSIEHKIKNIEDRHNNEIQTLQGELQKLTANFNIHKNNCSMTTQGQYYNQKQMNNDNQNNKQTNTNENDKGKEQIEDDFTEVVRNKIAYSAKDPHATPHSRRFLFQ